MQSDARNRHFFVLVTVHALYLILKLGRGQCWGMSKSESSSQESDTMMSTIYYVPARRPFTVEVTLVHKLQNEELKHNDIRASTLC